MRVRRLLATSGRRRAWRCSKHMPASLVGARLLRAVDSRDGARPASALVPARAVDAHRPRGRPRRARGDLGLEAGQRRARARGRSARGGRARGGAPCRGRCAPGGRAARVARPRDCRDGDRGRAHRGADGGGWLGDGHAGTRHGLRGGDDHLQRHRRAVPRRRDAPPARRDLQRRGHGHRVRNRDHPRHAVPRPPDVHDERAGPGVLGDTARVRRDRISGAVRALRLRADRSAP